MVSRAQDGVQVISTIDMVLVKRVKKDMLRYVQGVRPVSGMGRGLSDHYVVHLKFRRVVTCIKRRELVERTRRIRSESLREHQQREGYVGLLRGRE